MILMSEEEFQLTVQQEADLDQAAYEWVQEMKLIVNAIQGPNENKIGNIVAAAMKASCLEQIKEIRSLRTTITKIGEHLTRVTDQGVLLAEHLTIMNAVADEAAKALDFLSRKTCKCVQEIDGDGIIAIQHNEGCSVRIACEALAEIKKLMENPDANENES